MVYNVSPHTVINMYYTSCTSSSDCTNMTSKLRIDRILDTHSLNFTFPNFFYHCNRTSLSLPRHISPKQKFKYFKEKKRLEIIFG